jgi:Cys-rich repeat protein
MWSIGRIAAITVVMTAVVVVVTVVPTILTARAKSRRRMCHGPLDCPRDGASACVAGVCQPCRASSDCALHGDRTLCSSGACVKPQCAASADCPAATPHCDAGMCGKCTPATAAQDCASRSGTPKCDPSGACVACLVSGDCPAATPHCGDGRCGKCTEETQAQDCTASVPSCRTDTGVCVECLLAGDCAGEGHHICQDNKCVKRGCTTSPQCGLEKPRCFEGFCTTCTAATAEDDCGNRTGTTKCAPTGACVECTADGDCGQGRVCKTNKCTAAPVQNPVDVPLTRR